MRPRQDVGSIAFGSYRDPRDRSATRGQKNQKYEHMLCRALNLGTVVGFLGAGCSMTMGYPTWSEFVKQTIYFATSTLKGVNGQAARKHLDRLARSLATGAKTKARRPDSNHLMHAIGECQAILKEHGGKELDKLYEAHLERLFGLRSRRKGTGFNPYPGIFALDIHRFVTTNYDLELERQLLAHRHLTVDEEARDKKIFAHQRRLRGGPRLPLRSFSQMHPRHEDLVLCALAEIGDRGDIVFHCHGRYDSPESVVASEANYQRWYVSDEDADRRTFRQTIEILLGSNSLLFIGYGLSDDDLLRPLRYLKAVDPEGSRSRSLFALVPETNMSDESADGLFERYGLHVITFDDSAAKMPKADWRRSYARGLCAELQKIRECWANDQKEWSEKPRVFAFKPAAFRRDKGPFLDNPCTTDVPHGTIAEGGDLREMIKTPGVLALLAPRGSGKSKHLLTLLKAPPKEFRRCYYWNAHYSNEFLPAFDTALAFFGRIDSERSRHDNLRAALAKRLPCLLVIDGCERFLRETGPAREIRSYSLAFTQLLDELLEDCRSGRMTGTVVISGRVLPPQLSGTGMAAQRALPSPPRRGSSAAAAPPAPGKHDKPALRVLHVNRLVAPDLAQLIPGDKDRNRVLRSALISLMQGHSYGICLALHHHKITGDKSGGDIDDLHSALAQRAPHNRLLEMLEQLIKALPKPELYRALLVRMAQFVGPVCEATADICYRSAIGETEAKRAPRVTVALDLLVSCDLLFKMQRGGRDLTERYCVHSTARSLLLGSRHGLAPDVLPDFGISGFTSGRVDAYLEPEWRDQAKKLLDEVMRSCETNLRAGKKTAARRLCIDAFSLLRNTMSATTVARGKATFSSYVATLIRMVRLVKRVCGRENSWTYCDYFDRGLIENRNAPLHVAELAWLYNETGLALNAEGQLLDSYAVWEQTYEITRVMEHMAPGGGYRIEALLNLSHVLMELGRLPDARRYLAEAEHLNSRLREPDIQGRILGFRGLQAHLGGNLPEASALYEECARQLDASTNLRARSVFKKHQADLALNMGRADQAGPLIQESLSLAEAGVFPDLVAFARVSQAHLHAQSRRFADARREYDSLLAEARRMGALKLEAECLSTLAALYLAEGDIEGATQRAMRSLGLANELGLGLRVARSMVVLADVTVKAGQRELGEAYLKIAIRIASRQEYWFCRWKAENALRELGVKS